MSDQTDQELFQCIKITNVFNIFSALKIQRSQVLSRQLSRQISLEQGKEDERETKCQNTKCINEERIEIGQV
jgi:hypothetical protein